MKKLLNVFVIFAGILMIVGCDSKPNTSQMTWTEYKTSNGYIYDVFVIDGCEYISFGHGLSHKGNCTNSIHIYRMENK